MKIISLGGNGKAIIGVGVLVAFVVVGVVGTAVAEQPYGGVGIDVDQTEGEVEIIVVTLGNLDSMQLVAPSGTRSLVLREDDINSGSRLTIRSNETVYEFFEENNVTIPTTTRADGFVRITSPKDVPSQDLTLQNNNVTQDTAYDQRSAYLACLYDHGGFEVDGTVIQQNVSIPCHGPVFAQFDSVQAGTGKEAGNDTVTTPIVLEKGEYQFFGSVDTSGNCVLIQAIDVHSGETPSLGLGDTGEPEICVTKNGNTLYSIIGITAAVASMFITVLLIAAVLWGNSKDE